MPKTAHAAYSAIERLVPVVSCGEGVTYDSPVNFLRAMAEPRHRWFPYKEGFSPAFVRSFLDRYAKRRLGTICDPFSGVGTTVLEASRLGRAAIGIEVSPLAHFIAKTKATMLSASELRHFARLIDEFGHAELKHASAVPLNETVISYFTSTNLTALLRIKAFFEGISDKSIQHLFKLAFLGVIESASTHRKAGNGLKKKTTNETPVGIRQIKALMVERLMVMLGDLETSPVHNTKFVLGSALDRESYSSVTFDCVLTSPPYANCFDYSKIYQCELWLGDFFTNRESQRSFRSKSIRSHVHASWPPRNEEFGSQTMAKVILPLLEKRSLWSKRIPSMLQGYFEDLGKIFKLLHGQTSRNTPVGFVVSNSIYGGVPIATDLLVAEAAAAHGFSPVRIEVYRHIIPSSQQYRTATDRRYFRESLVVARRR